MPSLTTEMEQVAKRFEEAVTEKALDSVSMSYSNQAEIDKEYQEAKEELLECLSWVP